MTLEELEKRLKVLEDIEEIKKLQVHYDNCLITANWDEIVECFAEEGVLDLHAGLAKGKKEMEKLFKEDICRYHIGKEGEFAVHPIITVDGDKAKGSWLHYIQFAREHDGPRKLEPQLPILSTTDAPDWFQGFFEMEYIRENGKWKISRLKWRCRLVSPLQTSE